MTVSEERTHLLTQVQQSAARLGPFAERFHYFPEVGSTNDVAATLAGRGAPDGTTVVAGSQSSGRGRLGSDWFSPPGCGLYVSIVLRSEDSAPEGAPGLLTIAAGLALAEALERSTGLAAGIKWPNDLIVPRFATQPRTHARKIGGILAEAHGGSVPFAFIILGFGLNLRTAAYPPELSATATSIESELGRVPDPAAVLVESLASLAEVRGLMQAGESREILRRWTALSPSSRGAIVEWNDGGRVKRGMTEGVDDDGALLVRDGQTTGRILGGRIQWL